MILMNIELFVAFVLLTLVLVLTPGPIVTLVIATGARDGVRPMLVTVAGTGVGNAILVSSIAFGLSFVVRHAAILFEVLRWAGAAYLIFLGIQAWRRAGPVAAVGAPHRSVHFTRGLLVALSNPKTITFFTAFLPQFVDPSLPVERQLIVMCAVSIAMASVTDVAYGLAASAGRSFFLAPGRQKLLGRLSGLALIGGGVWLSLARRPG